MGFSTATVRVKDLQGVESDYHFRVPNEFSNGRISDEERMMAIREMARQNLPAGLSLVGDSFTLEEDASEKNPVTRLLTSNARETVEVTGLFKLFTPRKPATVITLPEVAITSEAPKKGTVIDVNDLPDAHTIDLDSLPTTVTYEKA